MYVLYGIDEVGYYFGLNKTDAPLLEIMEEDKALRELKGSNADMAAEKQDSKRIIIVFEKDGITNRLFIFSKDRESAIEWFRSLSYIRYK